MSGYYINDFIISREERKQTTTTTRERARARERERKRETSQDTYTVALVRENIQKARKRKAKR
jgi:hypothetical protein